MGGSTSFAFFCYKNCLIVLNVIYLVVSLVLIAIPAVAAANAKFYSPPIVGGVIASGVFLLVVAIIGLIGAVKHHQVLLFFYIITLSILFIILFAVSVAALAVDNDQRHSLLKSAWKGFDEKEKAEVQHYFSCCGFDSSSANNIDPTSSLGHPHCNIPIKEVEPPKCCHPPVAPTTNKTYVVEATNTTSCLNNAGCQKCCRPCYDDWSDQVANAFKVGGGVGLFFSLTELLGVIITVYYRNKKDPTANPNAFL